MSPRAATSDVSTRESTTAKTIAVVSIATGASHVISNGTAAPSANAIPAATPDQMGAASAMISSMPCSASSCAASASWAASSSATRRAVSGVSPLASQCAASSSISPLRSRSSSARSCSAMTS